MTRLEKGTEVATEKEQRKEGRNRKGMEIYGKVTIRNWRKQGWLRRERKGKVKKRWEKGGIDT